MRVKKDEIPKYDYYGLLLFLTFNRKEVKGERVICAVNISKRKESDTRSGKTRYIGREFSRCYKIDPALGHAMDRPGEIVKRNNTVDRLLERFFLPALFKEKPELLDAEIPFGAAAPFIWKQIQKGTLYAEDTKNDMEDAIETLLTRFGTASIGNLSPHVVKPWVLELTRESKKRAENSFRFLRRFFAELPAGLLPELRKEWEYATVPELRAEYSVPYHLRRNLLAPVLDDGQCRKIMELCEEKVRSASRPSAAKYFVAALMLVTGIEPNEACALYPDAFAPMEEYPGKYRLNITREAREQTNPVSKSVGRKRAKRYVAAELVDGRRRSLALGEWITGLLSVILKKLPNQELPLLYNEHNNKRILHPGDYRKWLDQRFGEIVGRPSVFSTAEISSKCDAAKSFAETAHHMLRAYGYMEEESRRQAGKLPLHTDATHYVSLSSDTELIKLSVIQDLWLANIRETPTRGSQGNVAVLCVGVRHPGNLRGTFFQSKLQ